MPEIMKTTGLPWLNVKAYQDSTVLVAQAHADDADWGCGGTAAMLADAGARVVYLVATKGDAGTNDPDMTRDKLVELRREEQRAANEILGVDETVFWDYADGRLNEAEDLVPRVTSLVRELQPDLVITFDPDWPEHSMHPDHRAIAIAAMRAAQFSNLSLTYTDEPAEPFQCKELLLFGPRRPNVWVNVWKHTFKKLSALAAHESQMVHLVPDQLLKLLNKMVERGDKPPVRLVAGLLHRDFIIEPFRRPKGMGLEH